MINFTWDEASACCEAGQDDTYSSRRVCTTGSHLDPEDVLDCCWNPQIAAGSSGDLLACLMSVLPV